MRIWTPKKRKLPPCNPRKKHLQTLSDVRAYRNRFQRNPWAKVGSLLVPQPLRLQSLGLSCCCEGVPDDNCPDCFEDTVPTSIEVIISGITGACSLLNGTYILPWTGGPTNCAYYSTPHGAAYYLWISSRGIILPVTPTSLGMYISYSSLWTFIWQSDISRPTSCNFASFPMPFVYTNTFCDPSADPDSILITSLYS